MDMLGMLLPGLPRPTESERSSKSTTEDFLEALTARLLQHVHKHEFDHTDFETFVRKLGRTLPFPPLFPPISTLRWV